MTKHIECEYNTLACVLEGINVNLNIDDRS